MKPLFMMLKPMSGACNMRCRYCFYYDVMSHRETRIYPRMSMETLETIVRRALRYADGPVSFAFQGGEPTLAGLDFYRALVEFQKKYNAKQLPISNSLQTNGFDLSDEMISFFARESFLLGVSLDGTQTLHDTWRVDADGNPTYSRICQTIERLQIANVQFNILCVVTEDVARHPREVFEALAPYHYIQYIACLDEFCAGKKPYSLSGEGYLHFLKETFDLYYKSFKAGKRISIRNFDNYIGLLMGMPPENCAMTGVCNPHFLVESDGSVYPCDFYVLDEWRIGRITESSIGKLERSELQKRFIRESMVYPDRCRMCKWFSLCRNGCKRERDPETDVNRWCECTYKFFDYSFNRMKEIAQYLISEGQ